jgi:hypothetical protein
MPPVTPAAAEELVRANLAALPKGARGAVVDQLAAVTCKSRSTVYRHLKEVTVQAPRKKRSDAGQITLSVEEARIISAWVMDGLRKNSKRMRSLKQALQELRYAGKVRAEILDAATGEITPLSHSAVSRALKAYGLHPDQLLRPAPAAAMQSLHPNHVWLIDASLCVLYYLKAKGKGAGVQVMDADKFYKNKPAALERVASERVWRYLVVDHYSGSLFCHYVLGAESGANLVETFIRAVTPRTVLGQTDPFCGAPFCVYMDPGSANTGALFWNLARRMNVERLVHAPGNARATGGVEKPQDIWECRFESMLRNEPIADLDALNEAAMIYSRVLNATETMTRHGRTRTAMWLTITEAQKRIAPDIDVLRQLVTHHPESRKVEPWPGPVVRFNGKVYDVSKVDNVMIGEKLMVTFSPYLQGHACVVLSDADGNEVLQPVPEVQYNEAGFPVNAAVLGQEYRRPADTVLQTNRKLVERIAMGADTDEAAAAARKAGKTAFAGEMRPLDEARNTVLPTPITRRGIELPITATTASTPVPVKVLTHFEAARALVDLGVAMSPELLATLKGLHADGVPEDQLEALAARLTVRAGLRVVAGGSK